VRRRHDGWSRRLCCQSRQQADVAVLVGRALTLHAMPPAVGRQNLFGPDTVCALSLTSHGGVVGPVVRTSMCQNAACRLLSETAVSAS